MRPPFIAGNWKMHTNAQECVALCKAVRERVAGIVGVEVGVCPPFPFLANAQQALAGSSIRLGAQNAHWEAHGAFTGEVSPSMLRGLVDYAIIGHSERRQYFCETDATVNKRLKAVLGHGLLPIFCIGETRAEREADRMEDVLSRQVREGLAGVAWTRECVVAYEPVWAIGTGLAATAEQANEAIGFIRGLLRETAGAEIADATRVQYGGSVKADNAAELFAQPEIDGALVGGASLDADAFAAIVRAAADTISK
ncbi:MAG: triose-phosphate isomerase [Dehalococcoidia bacterium]